MPNPLKLLTASLDAAFLADRLIALLIRGLLERNLTLVARPLVRVIRHRRGDDPVQGEQGQTREAPPPPGPFRLRNAARACDLLIFIPRSLESYFIDEATGSYGYSHVAVDVGEVDGATGKRVMTEATMGAGTHRSYLDTYAKRPFVRIPLAEVGLDCGKFRDCVNDKLGEPYSYAEALTWGQVSDPAKEVCTDVASDCLPTKMRLSIAGAARTGRLGRRTVSVHGPATLPLHLFVSPNGFARYFGAPRGHKVHDPDQLVHPRLRRSFFRPAHLAVGLLAGLGVAAGLWIGWQFLRPSHHD